MNIITIAPLGPGGMDTLTMGAYEAMRTAEKLVLRTGVNAVADELRARGIPFTTLDALYDECEDFDALCARAADTLLDMARSHAVCYAVPDPLSDQTVAALPANAVRVLPGVPLDAPVRAQARAQTPCRSVSATDIAAVTLNPREGLTITEMFTRELAGDVKLHLLSLYPDDLAVRMTGTGEVPLTDIDRAARYDHTTSVYIPPVPRAARTRFDIGDLTDIMRQLRAPDGCPWDRVQTHESLCPSMIEEAYEAVAAIDEKDDAHMAEELGDVLLQVVFHALIGEQYGTLDMTDITTSICQKMVSRHTHIFGQDHCETPDEVMVNWEKQKQRERASQSSGRVADEMDAVPRSFPMLLRTEKVQKRAHKVGFDFADAHEAFLKIEEEVSEAREAMKTGVGVQEELGDLLFAVCNVTRLMGMNAEIVLQQATEKFITRFRKMENAIISDGIALKDLTVDRMDVYWKRIKQCDSDALHSS